MDTAILWITYNRDTHRGFWIFGNRLRIKKLWHWKQDEPSYRKGGIGTSFSGWLSVHSKKTNESQVMAKDEKKQ